MKEFENKIKNDLSKIACSDFSREMSIDEIIKTWHAPKGVELCKKSRYPSAELMRKYSNEFKMFNVFVDDLDVNLNNKNCVLSNSVGIIEFSYPEQLYDVILYDDNVVTIKVNDYAVVNVHNLGNSVVVIEKDDYSIVNID